MTASSNNGAQALKKDPCEASLTGSTYTMFGDLKAVSGGKIAVFNGHEDSVYLVFSEKDLNPKKLISIGGRFEFSINRGADVELLYGDGKSHKFTFDHDTERNFYLDPNSKEIVYIDSLVCEGEDDIENTVNSGVNSKCSAWVLGTPWKYSSGCCNSDKDLGNIWGLVGCHQEWNVTQCCESDFGV